MNWKIVLYKLFLFLRFSLLTMIGLCIRQNQSLRNVILMFSLRMRLSPYFSINYLYRLSTKPNIKETEICTIFFKNKKVINPLTWKGDTTVWSNNKK